MLFLEPKWSPSGAWRGATWNTLKYLSTPPTVYCGLGLASCLLGRLSRVVVSAIQAAGNLPGAHGTSAVTIILTNPVSDETRSLTRSRLLAPFVSHLSFFRGGVRFERRKHKHTDKHTLKTHFEYLYIDVYNNQSIFARSPPFAIPPV